MRIVVSARRSLVRLSTLIVVVLLACSDGTSPPEAPITITTTSLIGGEVGVAYRADLAAARASVSVAASWRVTAGTLPAGLAVSNNAIAGMPTEAGRSTFTVEATAGTSTATKQLTLTITGAAPPLTITAPATDTPLPTGSVTTAYTTTFTAAGGQAPYTWTLSAGTLPAGLTVAPATGVLSGTPTTAANATPLTVQATDAAGATATRPTTLTITGTPPSALEITFPTSGQALPNGVVGTFYTCTFAASGGTGPYSWALTAGTLPAGLTLASGGLVSGTPTTAVVAAPLIVRTTDAAGATTTRSTTLTVTAAATPVQVTTPAAGQPLPGGVVGTAYTTTLTASGGQAPYTWSLATGTLPSGLTLASGGVVSGTPTTAIANTPLTVRATDATGAVGERSTSLTVSAAPPGLEVTAPDPLPDAVINRPYTFTLTASGGTAPYAWRQINVTLPGMTLSNAGVWSGTPTVLSAVGGTIQFEVTGGSTISRTRRFEALEALGLETPNIFATPPTAGAPLTRTSRAFGGRPPYRFDLNPGSPALPPGLTLNATTGVITGTPTTAGTTNVVLRVRDESRLRATSGATVPQEATAIAPFTIVEPMVGLTVALAGTGGGLIQGSGINCERSSNQTSGTCTVTLRAGTAVTLTPSADAASAFSGWTGCGAITTGACVLTLPRTGTTVTGTFAAATGTVRLRPTPSLIPGAGRHYARADWVDPVTGSPQSARCEVSLPPTANLQAGADPLAPFRTGDCDLTLPVGVSVETIGGQFEGYEFQFTGYVFQGAATTYRYVPSSDGRETQFYTRAGVRTECGTLPCVFSVASASTTVTFASEQWGRSFLTPRGTGLPLVRIYSPTLPLTPGSSDFKYDCVLVAGPTPVARRCQIDEPVGTIVRLYLQVGDQFTAIRLREQGICDPTFPAPTPGIILECFHRVTYEPRAWEPEADF